MINDCCRCVMLPAYEETDVPAEQCNVDVDGEECRNMDLMLPLQVCREQVYGYAEKEYHHLL